MVNIMTCCQTHKFVFQSTQTCTFAQELQFATQILLLLHYVCYFRDKKFIIIKTNRKCCKNLFTISKSTFVWFCLQNASGQILIFLQKGHFC